MRDTYRGKPGLHKWQQKTFGVKFEPGVVPDFMKDYAGELVCARRNVFRGGSIK